MLRKFRDFCICKGYTFPPQESAVVAEFLCHTADQVLKPNSYLKSVTAAMSAMYTGLGWNNPASTSEVVVLKKALIKAGTKAPRQQSTVMPIKPFRDLFYSWGENEALSIKNLRLKAIALLSLTIMLRPSDIAPKAQTYDPITKMISKVTFTTDSVHFETDGSAKITLMGIKNDLQRTGFVVKVPAHSDMILDPVSTLKCYIRRTEQQRPTNENPVFLTLNPPFRAISATTVASVLESAIKQAQLDPKFFSAKSFRPTGATVAIETGCNPDIVMKMGRWKTPSVFYDHYVHANTPASFTDDILEHE